MKKTTLKKKNFLLVITYLVLLIIPKKGKKEEKTSIKYNDNYQIENNCAYAYLNDKNIYIIDEKTFEVIEPNINKNDIYIIDKRKETNPTMSIYNSYHIKNLKVMKEILKMLLAYENKYPSNWERSINSMIKEWQIHNLFYIINYERERTKTVDLDNYDEETFNNILTITSQINEIIDINEETNEEKIHILKKQ